MLKLIKYEFRKTMFSKFILLLITAIAELLFLLGVFFKYENGLFFGIAGLVLCAGVGIIYIGIESLLVFQRDLNTKQSYMLFLTPRNSFQILGSKAIENGLSILFTGAFFFALAMLDGTIAILYIGGLEEFLDLLNHVFMSVSINFDAKCQEVLIVVMASLTSWLMTIATGYLAIVLCATVFAGKRFSGLISIIFFLILNCISGSVINHLPEVEDWIVRFEFVIVTSIILSIIMYLITSLIMERKLSV